MAALMSACVISEQGSGSFLGEDVVGADSDAVFESEAGVVELMQADKSAAHNNRLHTDLNIRVPSAQTCCRPVVEFGPRTADGLSSVS